MKVSQLTLALAAAVALPAVAAPQVEIFGFLDQGFTYLDESLSVGMGGPNSATQQCSMPTASWPRVNTKVISL